MFINIFSSIINIAAIIIFIYTLISINEGIYKKYYIIYSLNVFAASLIYFPVVIRNSSHSINDYFFGFLLTILYLIIFSILLFFCGFIILEIYKGRIKRYYNDNYKETIKLSIKFNSDWNENRAKEYYISKSQEYEDNIKKIESELDTAGERAMIFILSILYFIFVIIYSELTVHNY